MDFISEGKLDSNSIRSIKVTRIPLSDTLNTENYNSNNHHALGITYGHVLTEEEYNYYKVINKY